MGRMGIEISSGKVGKVRGVALPGTLLRGPLTPRIQNRSRMIYNLATWWLRPNRPEENC